MSDPFECTPQEHSHCVDRALRDADHICRQQGVRLTPIRRKVLELVWQNHRPVGAYDLLEQLQTHGRTAPPTVYRALEFLQQQGLIHRLESLNAFIGCARPHLAHQGQFLICRSCQSLAEITEPGIDRAILSAAETMGFKPQSQIVEVMGICANCQQQGDQGV